MKKFTNLLILSALALFACKKEDKTPEPPVLTFVDAGLSTDKSYAIVNFEFFDNDGDLGLRQNESTGEQEYNLFVDYYEKLNGSWTKKSPIITYNSGTNDYDTTVFHLRVPFIENDAGKSLKGETNVLLLYNPFTLSDTIRYELMLKDRALRSSNVITTSEIILN
jgi:hypothetical protein